jgi:hypothetical protein
MKLTFIFSILVMLGTNLYADKYAIAMRPPNGSRIPKVLGASGDLVPLTGYDYFDWFGITHHRTWFKPAISTLPYDGVKTLAAFKTACDAIRKEPMRQATSSDNFIDWNSFNAEFNYQVAEDMKRLKSLGIKAMICNTVFVSDTPITDQWTNIFKYWKSWYSMVYYLASNYDITMYEFRNEPSMWVSYETWESHWLIAADAMRKAMEDVNKNFGKNLPVYCLGPTSPGVWWDYNLNDPAVDPHGWDSKSWLKVKYDVFGNYNVNNPWNYGMYDFHRYTWSGEAVESDILEARNSLANARNDSHSTIPIVITEINTSTGANFTSKLKDTEDLLYGIGMAQIMQATACNGGNGLGNEGGFFQFKIGAPVSTTPAEGIQNRVCYLSNQSPNNYGGITRGGACFQLYAKHFRDSKQIVPFDVIAGIDPKNRTIAALDEEKQQYYIYGSTLLETVDNIEIDLNALDVNAGTQVTIQRVDAFNTGQITEVLTLNTTKKLSLTVSGMNAYLVTVPKANSAATKAIIYPTDDTMLSVADKLIHGAEVTMNVSINSTNPDLRKAAFVRFKLTNTDKQNRILLKLSGRNIGIEPDKREILHIYAVSNKEWSQSSLKDWTSGPGVGKYFITSTSMGTATGLGDMIDIEDNYAGFTSGKGKGLGIYGKFLGAVSFFSTNYKSNYLDVTDYVKSVSTGSNADVTFVISSIVRYNVNKFYNPYYYNLGVYHYDGRLVEIPSNENSNPELRPAIITLSDNPLSTIDQSIANEKLVVFPNPVEDFLTIGCTGEELFPLRDIKIVDANGRKTEKMQINSQNTINVKHLSSGLYYVLIQNKKKQYRTACFVKK